MATKAYILIKVKAGRTKDVLQALKRLAGVEPSSRIDDAILQKARTLQGFQGYLSLDKGDGYNVALYLWDDEASADRGQPVLDELAMRLGITHQVVKPKSSRAAVVAAHFPCAEEQDPREAGAT